MDMEELIFGIDSNSETVQKIKEKLLAVWSMTHPPPPNESNISLKI